MTQEFLQVVTAAISGDEAAFETLYKAKMKHILYVAHGFTHNKTDAEDIAQEVVLKMYRNIKTLRNPELFHAWLHSTIENECKMMFRKKGKTFSPAPQEDNENAAELVVETRPAFLPAEYAENAEQQQALLDAMKLLPPKQLEIIRMYYFEQMSTPQISKALKIEASTVRVHLHKAKRNLEKALGITGEPQPQQNTAKSA